MQIYDIDINENKMETTSHKTDDFPVAIYETILKKNILGFVDWHWHSEVEFASVSSGHVTCMIGPEKISLRPGEGIFINSGTIHRFESAVDGRMPGILFAPDFLSPRNSLLYEKYIGPVLSSSNKYIVFRQEESWHHDIMDMLCQIYTSLKCTDMKEYLLLQHALQLWRILFLNLRPGLAPGEQRGNTILQARLQIMIQYIHDHYFSRITLQDIAGAASVSKSEALYCFRTGIGSSPVAYLIKYRLGRAADLLLTTRMSVSGIARECGIDNAGYFCRSFKQEYGMTPLEFRKKQSPMQ